MDIDKNDMAYWFPKVLESGIPHPKTEHVVLSKCEIIALHLCACDGDEDLSDADSCFFSGIGKKLRDAARRLGCDCWFLRNGHFSGKHDFKACCFVENAEDFEARALNIVYTGECVSLIGFPIANWFVREYLPVAPLFTAFGSTPIVREFRLFAKNGAVHQWQPYWPASSMLEPDDTDWEKKLADASVLDAEVASVIGGYAETISKLMPEDSWSVDFLVDKNGKWYLTDMALEDSSYKDEDVRDWDFVF